MRRAVSLGTQPISACDSCFMIQSLFTIIWFLSLNLSAPSSRDKFTEGRDCRVRMYAGYIALVLLVNTLVGAKGSIGKFKKLLFKFNFLKF